MNKISSAHSLSLNVYQNKEMQKKYEKHINQIYQITQKKSVIK
jgi:hypothetical protein